MYAKYLYYPQINIFFLWPGRERIFSRHRSRLHRPSRRKFIRGFHPAVGQGQARVLHRYHRHYRLARARFPSAHPSLINGSPWSGDVCRQIRIRAWLSIATVIQGVYTPEATGARNARI